jgi:hypothetical protein
MEKIKNSAELKNAIAFLEIKQSEDWYLLQKEIGQFQENLKPLHLIKSAFSGLITAPSIKNDLVGTAVGLTAGLAVKAIAGGFSSNPIKKIIAAIFQFRVTNALAQKPGIVNAVSNYLIGFLDKNKK